MIVFRLVRRIIALLLMAAVLVVGITAFRVWKVARDDAHPTSDAIVVLGASQYNGRPSKVFKARLDHAKELYDDKVAPRVITVGGSRTGDRFTEAAAGKRYLQRSGVSSDDLVALERGSNTLRSMQALKRLMDKRGWDSAVIVTDPWHSLRSRKMARDQGIDAQTSPTRTGPAVATRGTETRYIARETAAYLYYRLFHKSAESGPRAVV